MKTILPLMGDGDLYEPIFVSFFWGGNTGTGVYAHRTGTGYDMWRAGGETCDLPLSKNVVLQDDDAGIFKLKKAGKYRMILITSAWANGYQGSSQIKLNGGPIYTTAQLGDDHWDDYEFDANAGDTVQALTASNGHAMVAGAAFLFRKKTDTGTA